MKNVLMACAAVALLIVAGSVAYYFVVFLPHQQSQSQNDISAIRSAVAPTPQEQAHQQAAAQKSEAQFQAQLDAYQKCIVDMVKPSSDYISRECSSGSNNSLASYDPLKYMTCASAVQQTAYFKEHFTCKAPY